LRGKCNDTCCGNLVVRKPQEKIFGGEGEAFLQVMPGENRGKNAIKRLCQKKGNNQETTENYEMSPGKSGGDIMQVKRKGRALRGWG